MKNIKDFLTESFSDLQKKYMALDEVPAIMFDVLSNAVDHTPENLVDMTIAMATGLVPSPGSDDDITEKDYEALCEIMKKLDSAWEANKKALRDITDASDDDVEKAKAASDKTLDDLLGLITTFSDKLNAVYGSKVTEAAHTKEELWKVTEKITVIISTVDTSSEDKTKAVTDLLVQELGLADKADKVEKEVKLAMKLLDKISKKMKDLGEPKKGVEAIKRLRFVKNRQEVIDSLVENVENL